MEEKEILEHSTQPKKSPGLPNPRLDANFKGMFTKDCEDSYIALKSFLSAMIGEPVTDVIVRENEEATQYKGQKGIRYDIKCQFGDGTKAQVEIRLPYGKPTTPCFAGSRVLQPDSASLRNA